MCDEGDITVEDTSNNISVLVCEGSSVCMGEFINQLALFCVKFSKNSKYSNVLVQEFMADALRETRLALSLLKRQRR